MTYVDDTGDNGAPGWYSSYSPNVLAAGATNLFLNTTSADITKATETGTTVTIATATPNGFSDGDPVTIAGVNVAGYNNGPFQITSILSPTSFTYTAAAGLTSPASGGTATIGSGYNNETAWSNPSPANVTIVDNSSASGFAQTGSWTQSTSGGYKGNFQTASPGANTATWTFSVPKNTNMGVSLTWVAAAANADNASFTVFDGNATTGTVIATYTADEKLAPTDNTGTAYDPSTPFQKIATFVQSTTGTITVQLNANGANGNGAADGLVCADAVAVSNDSNFGGTGGGISQFETQPTYQNGLVIHNGNSIISSNDMRTVPDVSFVGGTETWVQIVDTLGGNTIFAGTSLATPCWAALTAIADQGRALGRALGGTLQSLDTGTSDHSLQAALYTLPSADFHDITSGYNGYSAGPDYDLVTGLGTPVANLLIPDLAGTSIDYTVPTAGSPHQLVLEKVNTEVELLDNGVEVGSSPLGMVSDVNITDPNTSNDSLLVDYAYDGIFAAQVNFDHTGGSGYQTVSVDDPDNPGNAVSVTENPAVAGAGSIVVDGAARRSLSRTPPKSTSPPVQTAMQSH